MTLLLVSGVQAQTQTPDPTVNYGDQPAVDMDFDGLTDTGERDVYKTDPNKADTDGDSFLDGVEVISNTDPLDAGSNIDTRKDSTVIRANDTPWVWYITRSSGIIAFVLLYLSFFFGFGLRLPWLRKLLKPFNFIAVHRWVSVQALLFTFIHAAAPLFDTHMKLAFTDILVPFASEFAPNFMAAGIIGMYLMIILIGSSYLQKRIPYLLWRVLHYFYVVIYAAVVYHAIYLGTDFASQWVIYTIYAATGLLIILALLSMRARIATHIMKKRRLMQTQSTTPHAT